MKKIIKFLILLIFIIIIPKNVYASGSVTVSTNNMTINKGSTGTFTITATNAVGRIDISSTNSDVVTVDKTSEWIENQSITVTVTGVNVGTGVINVKLSDAATFDEEPLTGNYTIYVTVKELSSNNKLNNIKIDGSLVPNFNTNVLSYTKTVPNTTSSVNITAEKSDSKASITGTGVKNLNVGNNTINIVVTSESGITRTYSLIIKREASATSNDSNNNTNNNNDSTNKSNINTLDAVEITNVNDLNFDKTITNYNLNVKSEIEEVEIKSTLTDSKSKYVENYGNRKVELKEGLNTIEIKVEAENGDIKTYTFNINREKEQSEITDYNNINEQQQTEVVDKDNNTSLTFPIIILTIGAVLLISVVIYIKKSN